MCSYKSGFYTIEDLEFYWNLRALDDDIKVLYKPHYYENAYDHLLSPVMVAADKVGLFSWGLIPWFTKDLQAALIIRNQTINAKSEEMFDKPSFRDALRDNRRCLIPATGFFEWQWRDPDATKSDKQPYFIHTKSKLFSFAGIWSAWEDKTNGKEVNTFSILTCAANPLMEKIHNHGKRMPVIIPDDYLHDWLNPNLSKEDVLAFCKPYDPALMDAYPVDRRIGSTKLKSDEKDVADILKKIEPVEAAPVSEKTENVKAKKVKGDPGQGSLF